MADDFKYDVFLSHNSKDKPAVENIARLLRDVYNLKAWLDKWNLVPGEAWQDALEDALDESQAFAVFLGPSGIGSWENEEMRTAIEDRVQDPQRRVIPVLLPGAPDNKDLKLPRFLRRATWVDFRSGLDDEEALYRLYCGIAGQAPGDRGSSKSDTGTPETWNLKHPYPMPPNFTGRISERTMLTKWLNEDKEKPLFILRALGGFGKSALSWHWITHDVDIKEFPKVLWWSFYEGDASFEHFTEETLKYLNQDVPQSKRDQVDALLKAMQSENVLLLMDGFERVLRAYSSMSAAYQGDEEPKLDDTQLDCVDVNAEIFLRGICSLPNIKGKVLMTTRLTPRTIKPRGEFMLGCSEFELTAMQKADAVEFFHKQGIKGNRGEIESACEPYGYHPLSLRLLAGRILKDFENPADIAVAQKLKIDGDIIQQKHHVLEVSYNSLPQHEQKLLSTIACFRSPVELKTIEAIANNVGAEHAPPLQNDLHDLVDRGLLHFDDKNKKFDLHPIVRRFAYDQLTASDRTAAHTRLVNYFDAVPKLEKVDKLEDLAPVIELYHHMVRAGNLDEALDLFYDRISQPTYYQFGAYQLRIELLRALFLDGEDKPPRLKKEGDQAWTLNGLANTYSVSGQPRRAVPLFEMQTAIREREKEGNKKSIAIGLGNVASMAQIYIGSLSAAERNLRRQIDLSCEIEDEKFENVGHRELGRILSYYGNWKGAEQELNISEKAFKKIKQPQSQSVSLAYLSLNSLLHHRSQSKEDLIQTASNYARQSLALAEGGDPNIGGAVVSRDLVRSRWLLGAAFRANNELTLAEENLFKALNLCRQINMVDHEANILLDLARLRYAQGDFKDAQEKASEALVITERSGYVLQGADVNLFLAQYALEQEKDKAKAKAYAESALKLAYCDGPPYYYKVAYEEADVFLKT